MALDAHDIAMIKGMLTRGDRQSDIAAWFGCNSGRVSEINTAQLGAGVGAAPAAQLPPPGPYTVSVRGALKARETLTALRGLIDDALSEISAWESRAASED